MRLRRTSWNGDSGPNLKPAPQTLRVARLSHRGADDISQQCLGEEARLRMALDGGGQGTTAPKNHVAPILFLDLGETAQLAEQRDRTINARAQIPGRRGLSAGKPVTHLAEKVVEGLRRQAFRENVEHQAQ